MAQLDNLSNREKEVIALLLEGKSNKLIASALHISESTVEFHLTNIYAKLQVGSRTELILKLGQSTVAGTAEDPENRDSLNAPHWAASLKEAVLRIGREINAKLFSPSDARSGGNTMTFFEAIRTCLTKYAEFNGRASRAEFWWFFLFVLLVDSALVLINETLGSIFLIAVLLPLLAAGARRLHDTGRSGWWQLYLLVPVGGLVILGIYWAQPPVPPLPNDTVAA